jgi:hypothetical protein
MLTRGLLYFGFGLVLAASSPAWAGSIECDTTLDPSGVPQCGWKISVQDADGNILGESVGTFDIEPEGNVEIGQGDTFISGPTDPATGEPVWSASIGDPPDPNFGPFGGHVDPELVFGLGATNNTNAVAVFAFAFNLPLGGFGPPIVAEAALGTTLTAPSDANATVFPTLGVGKIVDSQDIRLSPFQSVDKGVDIGDRLTDPAGGVSTLRNELEFGSINSGGPFDLMTITVAFGLTDDSPTAGSGVGFSGRVTQIPEPGTIVLLGAGLFGLAWLRRQQS